MVRLIEPTYFPPISHWKFIKSKDLSWSINSRYNKQTLTNRTYIDSANGELMLTVPIKHSGKNQPRVLSDIKLEKTPSEVKHFYNLKSGITQEESKEIISLIKKVNKKAQCAYQNQSIRVSAKKRDDLQEIIQLLKDSDIDTPINFGNFRD